MKRILYIDSAKGVSMMLIVAMHVHVPEPWPYAYDMMVAIFFMLSGYFFKPEIGWVDTIRKKSRSLLVPFFIFWVASYVIFYLLKCFSPGMPTSGAKGIFDCFTQHEYFNGPLWFLPSLFFVQLLALGIYKLRKDTLSRLVIAFGLGYCGYLLGVKDIYLPLGLDTALTATPFFCFGYESYRRDFYSLFRLPISLALIAIMLYISWREDVFVEMSTNSYNCHYISMLGAITIMSVSVVALCKICSEKILFLDKSLSFVGRNSMWLLCTHHLVYRPIKLLIHSDLTSGGVIVFAITLAICLSTAPIAERYFPILIGKHG